MKRDAVIVGAGLAGLCCARRLHEDGKRCLVVEACDAVGGRIRTDGVDGFQLDRGFQVFLTAYPEAKRVLDYSALELKPFIPGALVRFDGAFHRVVDPWRQPIKGVRSAVSPIGTMKDKLRVGGLRAASLRCSIEQLFDVPEMTTIEALEKDGFSSAMIERFFRPFLGGIFLDRDLQTSNRMFNFVFHMFAKGKACLPAAGMEAIPRQLAAALPPESVRLNTRVAKVEPKQVTLDTGETIEARHVIVATEGPAAARLLGDEKVPGSQSVTCLYFAADTPPIDEPILVLNGDGVGPINNLCVPSQVAPTYAPAGCTLVSVTVLGDPPRDDATLESEVRGQLTGWFGEAASGWRHLRTYRIAHALPNQAPPALARPTRPVRLSGGLFVCGDHRDNASINGAMASGRRAAEAVLKAYD